MKVDFAQCVNKGMQRDYSMDKSSQEFAYENKNIRITSNIICLHRYNISLRKYSI